MKFKKQAHCVYHCQYHLVLTTKYRRKIFNEGVFAYFRTKLLEIKKYYPELEYEEVNHDEDHVHLMMWIPPKMSVSSVVRIVKANTARGLKGKFPFLKEVYWGTDGIWSDGYFVCTTGLDEGIIRRYIEMQGREDAGQAMLELG
jgi:putative transposase